MSFSGYNRALRERRPNFDSSDRDAPLSALSSRRRDVSLLKILTNSTMTNSTLESAVCGPLSTGTYTGVSITPGDSNTLRFSVPTCINTSSTFLVELYLDGCITQSGIVPSSLLVLEITNSVTAFHSLDWSSLFDIVLPNLVHFKLKACTGVITTTLPDSLPSRISYFVVEGIQLYGSIPATLFQNYTPAHSLTFSMASNSITGEIPAALFAPFLTGANSLPDIDITFDNNILDTNLPDSLFGIVPSALSFAAPLNASFRFSATSCFLTGTIPANLFGTTAFTGSPLFSFIVLLRTNTLTGTIPPALLSGVKIISTNTFQLVLLSNLLEGSIPATLLAADSGSFSVDTLILSLSSNAFNGSIPQDLFKNVATTSSFALVIDNCHDLNSSLPTASFFNLPSGVSSFSFSASPSVVGTLPAGLFASVRPPTDSAPASSSAASSSINSYRIALIARGLVGTIPSDLFSSELGNSNTARLSLVLSDCNFSGTIPSSWNNISFVSFLLDNNSNLTGTIPSSLLSSSSAATYVSISGTSLSGVMPIIKSSSLQNLLAVDTTIDFCSNPESPSMDRPVYNGTSLIFCTLQKTNACTCKDRYPAHCTSACDRTPTPSPCPLSTYPGPGFYCNGTIWVSDFSVLTPTLTIPSGATQTVVTGDVASSTIVFNGFGSTLTLMNGCTTNLTTITISLTEEEAKKIGKNGLLQQLISYYGTAAACNNSDSVTLNVGIKTGGCRKVKATIANESSTSLSAFFTLDTSKCNLWWIILVSVIAGLVLLGAIGLALLAACSPAFRRKVRPFADARQNRPLPG